MVKGVGPCFSLDAAQTMGGVIEYRRSKGQAIISQKHKPGGRAPFILGYHAYYARVHTSEAVRHWHLLTTAQKQEWDDYVD